VPRNLFLHPNTRSEVKTLFTGCQYLNGTLIALVRAGACARRVRIGVADQVKKILGTGGATACRITCSRLTGKGGHHVSHINYHRGGRYTMNAPASITITPVRVADLLAEGERMPVYVHVIDHPDAHVLVDTGMTELHPAVADLDPRLRPLSKQDFDVAGIDIVINTHLHFDHCGGNHLFAGRPIYVQRRELDDARSENDYTIREWVEAHSPIERARKHSPIERASKHSPIERASKHSPIDRKSLRPRSREVSQPLPGKPDPHDLRALAELAGWSQVRPDHGTAPPVRRPEFSSQVPQRPPRSFIRSDSFFSSCRWAIASFVNDQRNSRCRSSVSTVD
jgi:Metallo-beta-lactamase superfamily